MKIRKQTNKGHLVAGVCYRLPDQGSLSTRHFASDTGSITLTSSHPDGGLQPPGHLLGNRYSKQSRGLLESVGDNFLVQVLDKLTRAETLLDLVITNEVDEHIKEVKIRGSLGCNKAG